MESKRNMENIVSDLIIMLLNDYDFHMELCGVDVRIKQDECHVTFIFNDSFSLEESDKLYNFLKKEQDTINGYFANQFSYFRVGSTTKKFRNNHQTFDF